MGFGCGVFIFVFLLLHLYVLVCSLVLLVAVRGKVEGRLVGCITGLIDVVPYTFSLFLGWMGYFE
ncbi:hypothetical protein HOY82DRAFT_580014 [Tuber indicum]|nr:hypothetical protein HOY82DRAFT_580014 [Tuber indicum]